MRVRGNPSHFGLVDLNSQARAGRTAYVAVLSQEHRPVEDVVEEVGVEVLLDVQTVFLDRTPCPSTTSAGRFSSDPQAPLDEDHGRPALTEP